MQVAEAEKRMGALNMSMARYKAERDQHRLDKEVLMRQLNEALQGAAAKDSAVSALAVWGCVCELGGGRVGLVVCVYVATEPRACFRSRGEILQCGWFGRPFLCCCDACAAVYLAVICALLCACCDPCGAMCLLCVQHHVETTRLKQENTELIRIADDLMGQLERRNQQS